MGYKPISEEILSIEGKRMTEIRVRCSRESWQRDVVPVTIEGLEPCLKLFGVGRLSREEWAPL